MAKKISIKDDVEVKSSLFSEICGAIASVVIGASFVIYLADMFFTGCGFPIWLVACATIISWIVIVGAIILLIIVIAFVIFAFLSG